MNFDIVIVVLNLVQSNCDIDDAANDVDKDKDVDKVEDEHDHDHVVIMVVVGNDGKMELELQKTKVNEIEDHFEVIVETDSY